MRLLLIAMYLLAGCNDTTGSGLVTFAAQAGGPSDATGAALDFDTGLGYHVHLTRARFHLGAVYLNMTRPSSGGGEQPCVEPGIYVGQAFANLDLDLLSPSLSDFESRGQGTFNHASEAEVWLTGGDINAVDDSTPILDVAGTASKGSQTWPFSAVVTIGQNRALPIQNPALPGENPICHQRIVNLIPIDFTLTDGGTLAVRVDPRGMFNGVDFTTLMVSQSGDYPIPDQPGGAGGALYKGVRANSGVYQLSWSDR